MNQFMNAIMRRLLKDEDGQSLVLMGATVVAVLGLAGLSMDVGHGYFAYQKLVAATNAATLAGAAAMPNTTTATANALLYSAESGQLNATSLLTNVVETPTFECLTTVSTTFGVPCTTSTGGSGGNNAIQVTQTASVSTWFGGMFGVPTFNLSATSTAAMKGGTVSGWNIAIILDATKSMSDSDSGTQCTGTQEHCALLGIQALLEDLYPCALGQNCTTSTSVADDVALYQFPPVTTASAPDDYCSGGSPSNIVHGYYVVPTLSSSYTYQIVAYSNNYKASDSATTLNTSSDLAAAAGYTGTSCTGVDPVGGAGTYYAQAIYQAQSDLASQLTTHKGTVNAMIILSDGNATSTTSFSNNNCTGGKDGYCTANYSSSSDLQPSSNGSLNGVTDNNPTSYTYPSAVGLCGQAVVAAQAANTAGTRVYTIGYGSETSGCTTDATYSASVTTGNGVTWGPGDSPCKAIGAMASSPADFFSDDGNGCVATNANNASIKTLTAIFRQIFSSLTVPRLIPNGTT